LKRHSLIYNGVIEVSMAKTKTRDEVMAEAYWTPKEKEDLSSRYSTSLIKENCNGEELKDKSLPSDAYIVTYKVDDAVRNDLVRCHAKVNIFDMYYDKFGAGSIVSIEYGPGIVSPKTWGLPVASKPKKRVRRNS